MSTESTVPRRYWSLVNPMPVATLTAMARMAEEQGLHGLFAPQVYGPPFIPLAAAAAVTERVQLASGIAIAAARHIVSGAHVGLTPFEGTYYRADFKELQPTSAPVREEIPIWIAALRAPLVRLAAEVGDGLIGHPMWSNEWALERMRTEFESALATAGRRRTDVEVNLWPWAAPNPNEAEAIEDARPTMAFYGGVKQYEPFFEAHGFRDVARQLQEGVQHGSYQSVAHLVPDEMVRTFVAVGEPAKVRERVEGMWSFADSLCIVPPIYGLPPEKVFGYFGRIAETFYG